MSHSTTMPSVHPAPSRESASQRLRLSDVKRTIWLTRPDLRELVRGDQDRLEGWLVLNGVREYEALAELGLTVPKDDLTEPAPEALPQVRPTLTRFMKMVWSMRPDLQEIFDLREPEGQSGFVWWYFVHGVGELHLSRFLTDNQRVHLNEADARLPSTGFLPITRLMVEVWRRRPDLQQSFNLREPRGRDAFLAWYFARGIVELDLAQMVDGFQARMLLSPSPESAPVPWILALLWAADSDLQDRFSSMASDSFRQWAASDVGQTAYPVLRRLRELAGHQKPVAPGVCRAPANLPFGVNLVGYARGQFGIGEDVRMAALACEAAGIPFSIYNIEPGREVCQGDESAWKHVSDALPYAVNVFCTTGIETARLAAVHGSKLFDGRRSIGYWPWELPEWPADWHHAYHLVDEVWASSRFTYEAFARSCPKPVRHMPMAVTVDQTEGLTRCDFRLPEGHFLFVFAFDFLSTLSRKNPQACLSAFRRAFPRGDEPVGLVVKAMRATDDNPLWQALLAEAQADGRIHIISGTLGRGALLDLYRACDGFVSLHRSEGFGRGMVEAMMLGKPVIATGHSGNMDFTVPGAAGVVDHRPCRVGEGDYPFGVGMTWAEPDVNHAAWWMRRIASNQDVRGRLARTAQILVEGTYAPGTVGALYRAVLRDTSMVAPSAERETRTEAREMTE